METQGGNPYLVPLSIVVAGAIVAGAVFFSGRAAPGGQVAAPPDGNSARPAGDGAPLALREITEEDHIRGSFDAPVKIVEFSDLECPFCQRFHGTMQQVVDEYGEGGEVAWVYRHLPLDSIHPEARPGAVAAECVSELAGEDAFWAFVDGIFENQSRIGDGLFTELARGLGIDDARFASCRERSDIAARVQRDAEDATRAGARGTPHSLIVLEDGTVFQAIPGALPFSAVDQAINQALTN